MGRRTIHLVRHGQHNTESEVGNRLGPSLTSLGRRQSRHAARALSHLKVDRLHVSTLNRTRETGDIIAAAFENLVPRPSRLLWETIPTRPTHPRFKVIPRQEIESMRQRSERVFQKYFRSARGDRDDILVTHGNLIRYLVCRTLGMRVRMWLNMGMFNASITEITVDSDGGLTLVSFNQVTHIPQRLRTGI